MIPPHGSDVIRSTAVQVSVRLQKFQRVLSQGSEKGDYNLEGFAGGDLTSYLGGTLTDECRLIGVTHSIVVIHYYFFTYSIYRIHPKRKLTGETRKKR